MRILVVDSSFAQRRAAREQLSGHELIFAPFRIDAEHALRRGPRFDVMLTDLNVELMHLEPWEKIECICEPAGFLLSLMALEWLKDNQGAQLAAVVSLKASDDHPGNYLYKGLKELEFSVRFKTFMGADCPCISHTSGNSLVVKDWGRVLREITSETLVS